jgi:hypothetical protein
MCFFFNPGPVWRVPIPNRYTAKAKLCFCKNNKRTIIIRTSVEDAPRASACASSGRCPSMTVCGFPAVWVVCRGVLCGLCLGPGEGAGTGAG